MEKLVEYMEALESNRHLFETLARVTRKLYDALLKQGFTPEQAILIVTTRNMWISLSGEE